MSTMVLFIWITDDEGGYGVCTKDTFIEYTNGMCRKVLFEFNTYDEFISKMQQVCPEEDVVKMAEELCIKHD